MEEVSVIVPVYKVEEYLPKCIESILVQTYKNIEVILVNDGSPDRCGEICDEYAKKDSRIKVIHKENGGLSDARNKGIDASNGDYIVFVDSDDYLAPEAIETLYNLIMQDNGDLAICNFCYVDEKGNEIEQLNSKSPIKNEVISRESLLEKLVLEGNWYYVVAVNKLYKKEVFSNIRFPVGKLHEDEFVIHHIINKCRKITCTEKALYYYVQREESIMNKPYNIKRLDVVEAYIDRIKFFLENNAIYCAEKTANMVLKVLKNARQNLDLKNSLNKKRYQQTLGLFKKFYFNTMLKNFSLKSKVLLAMFCISPVLYERFLFAYSKILKLKRNN